MSSHGYKMDIPKIARVNPFVIISRFYLVAM